MINWHTLHVCETNTRWSCYLLQACSVKAQAGYAMLVTTTLYLCILAPRRDHKNG